MRKGGGPMLEHFGDALDIHPGKVAAALEKTGRIREYIRPLPKVVGGWAGRRRPSVHPIRSGTRDVGPERGARATSGHGCCRLP
jgi:hypothetical protein